MNRNTIYEKKNNYNKNAISNTDIRMIANILRFVNITNTIDIFDRNKIKGILNKLDINNKESVSNEILEYIQTNDTLDEVFEEIVENVLHQVKYIEVYVHLIQYLRNIYPDKMNKNIQKLLDNFRTELGNFSPKLNNFSIFLSTIVNYKMIDNIDDIIYVIIQYVIDEPDCDKKQILIESLFNIITHLKSVKLSDTFINKLNIIKNDNISTKSKFQLMDINDELKKKC